MAANSSDSRDIALAPGIYAHIQDTNRGVVLTYVGPTKVNGKDQDRYVKYDPSARVFVTTDAQRCICNSIHVAEGQYAVLRNPAFKADTTEVVFPKIGDGPQEQPALAAGQSVNIPGPIDFALWPEQSAEVIDGHKLRSDQYLLVSVIDSKKAQANWAKAIVQTADGEQATADSQGMDFTTGALNVIKGTECKFFIPCTGLEVLEGRPRVYVRDAIGLETLEYCILLDESGAKRYERGTREGKTVFPEPTESFWQNDKGETVFRAYELTEISGVFIKVIADYKDEVTGEEHKAGEEIFITGKGIIYFPRAEHAIIKYGEHARHYATAIPPGEGRYVMNRLTGEIHTVRGPYMLLCNPSQEVNVRRILPDRLCKLYYPGNDKVRQYNAHLAGQSTTASLGYMAENEAVSNSAMMSFAGERSEYATRSLRPTSTSKSTAMAQGVADQLMRKMAYTPPRTLTLDTGMEGAVSVDVWPGYAVTVVDKRGGRRVVQGRDTVILNYDETLEVLQFSTGKPKNTDHLDETVFLRILNNKVSDIVAVQTSDHVEVRLKLCYRVNFEGDPNKWFAVDNYVKLLCDHIRSVLKGTVRRMSIKDFYADPVSVVRDTLLGASAGDGTQRKGMTFDENGMRVIDVDILGTDIVEGKIAQELSHAQYDALTKTLHLENQARAVAMDAELQKLTQQQLLARAATAELEATLARKAVEADQLLKETQAARDQAVAAHREKLAELQEDIADLAAARDLAREKAERDQQLAAEATQQAYRLEAINAETQAVVARFQASGQSLAAFAATLADAQVREGFLKAVVALTPISGGTLAQTIERALPGLGGPLADSLRQLVTGSTIGSSVE